MEEPLFTWAELFLFYLNCFKVEEGNSFFILHNDVASESKDMLIKDDGSYDKYINRYHLEDICEVLNTERASKIHCHLLRKYTMSNAKTTWNYEMRFTVYI